MQRPLISLMARTANRTEDAIIPRLPRENGRPGLLLARVLASAAAVGVALFFFVSFSLELSDREVLRSPRWSHASDLLLFNRALLSGWGVLMSGSNTERERERVKGFPVGLGCAWLLGFLFGPLGLGALYLEYGVCWREFGRMREHCRIRS